ncbi:hypothetical protein B0O99DRAFT_681564 [Bisporella sp. PMI_857]|nr:hypothetical protein B0O99DRAFT_681564 [Bisporella sp. PMI_857]
MSSEATLADLYAKIAARLKASQSLSRNQNSLTGGLQGSEEISEQVQHPYNNNQNQISHPTLNPINAVLTQQGRYAQQPQVLNEDISETTSVTRKRGYEEHMFDLCGTPWQSSFKRSKPMRRGILSSSTQENIAKVKKAGGACWRCKMLKKPCDGATPCKQCENNNGALWDIECIRGSLQIPYDHWDGSKCSPAISLRKTY